MKKIRPEKGMPNVRGLRVGLGRRGRLLRGALGALGVRALEACCVPTSTFRAANLRGALGGLRRAAAQWPPSHSYGASRVVASRSGGE
eukprot:scaffold16066_cov41-Phaeocystis_antarctica.AAC.1